MIENIKAPRHWPLWGEFTGDRGEFPAQMISDMDFFFSFDDIIMLNRYIDTYFVA